LLAALDSLSDPKPPTLDLHADYTAYASLVASFRDCQKANRIETLLSQGRTLDVQAQLQEFTRLVDGFKNLMQGDALIARRYPHGVAERLGDEAMRKEVEEIRRRCQGRGSEVGAEMVGVGEEEKMGVEGKVREMTAKTQGLEDEKAVMKARITELES
jgi:hypothetical protein